MPFLVQELETCVNFVPLELTDSERSSPETLEKAEIIKKAHVTGEHPTADNFMDVSTKYFCSVLPEPNL